MRKIAIGQITRSPRPLDRAARHSAVVVAPTWANSPSTPISELPALARDSSSAPLDRAAGPFCCTSVRQTTGH